MPKLIIVFVLILISSSVKYSFATIWAADSELGLIGAFISNFSGGLLGVLGFTLVEGKIKKWLKERRKNKPYRIFNRKNRILVKIRRRFGLIGIAFITPVLLTIPLGVMMQLSLTQNRKKIILYTLLSCLFWTSAILIPYKLLGIDITEYIKNLFINAGKSTETIDWCLMKQQSLCGWAFNNLFSIVNHFAIYKSV